MKKFIPLFVVTLAVVLFFNGKKYDELVSSRLNSSVAICLEGQSCGQATAMTVARLVVLDLLSQFIPVVALPVMMPVLQAPQ